MFQNIMSLMRGLYNIDDDESNSGLEAAIDRLDYFLLKLRPKLSKKMK